MYKLNKIGILLKLVIRYNFLSKKFLKKNRKGVLVYLRSPKHFNIGKHKIFSFKNLYSSTLVLNWKFYVTIFLKYPQYLFKVATSLEGAHSLKKINSLRISYKQKIKWI